VVRGPVTVRAEREGGESPPSSLAIETFGRRLATVENILIQLLEKKEISPEDHLALKDVVNARRKAFTKASVRLGYNRCTRCRTGLYDASDTCIYCGETR